jgi:hypothetical protein
MKSSNRSLSSFSLFAASMRSLYVRLSGERSCSAALDEQLRHAGAIGAAIDLVARDLAEAGTVGSAR